MATAHEEGSGSRELARVDPITVVTSRCVDWETSSRLEWLETSDGGAFAMGTVSGARSRRYHGLLVGSRRPPSARQVTLAKLEEEIHADGRLFCLDANRYPGAVHPRGFESLTQFRLDPFPVWAHRLGGLTLEKQLFLPRGASRVVVQYRADAVCRLTVRPHFAQRDYHSLLRASPERMVRAEDRSAPGGGRRVDFRSDAGLPVTMHHSGGAFVEDARWYYDVELVEESDRGFESHEDLSSPGSFDIELGPGRSGYVVASLDEGAVTGDDVVRWEAEERRRRPTTSRLFQARLEAAADSFVALRGDGSRTILAGFPWFTDWGRDAMISLPGIFLARGKLAEAKEVLSGFLEHEKDGLIPNRFPDRGELPEYNTGDATMWLIVAAHAYIERSGDVDFLRTRLYPSARKILHCHETGAPNGIVVDPADHLLIVGGPGTQLSWMDARIGDFVPTPRHGKPVEINALYYNALRIVAGWARRLGDHSIADSYESDAAVFARSFDAAFWNESRSCLYDVIAPGGPIDLLRPNQIFAVSLPFVLLDERKRKSVVAAVEINLLTPYGLRTLAPGEPGYCGHYTGGPSQRDAVYHQGTVWPWLLGPFLTAYVRVHAGDGAAMDRARAMLGPLEQHLNEGCLGTIAEIFDGDAPHAARGAPSQAWSVAELLRVMEGGGL